MNYIMQFNAFGEQIVEKRLSPYAQTLYGALFRYFNRQQWKESCRPTNDYLLSVTNLSETQFKRARAELAAAELISYEPMKTKNDSEGGAYMLIRLYKDEPVPVSVCASNYQNEVQNKAEFAPQNSKSPATYKNNIKAYKQRESESAASGFVSLFKSKFKEAFPGKDVDSVNFIPADMDVDLLIKSIRDSPGWLMANDALCDLKFCIKHYSEIIAGRYKDSSLFTQPRAGPAAAAAGPNDPQPGESEEAFRKRYNESNRLKE